MLASAPALRLTRPPSTPSKTTPRRLSYTGRPAAFRPRNQPAARPDRSYVQTLYGVGYRFEPTDAAAAGAEA